MFNKVSRSLSIASGILLLISACGEESEKNGLVFGLSLPSAASGKKREVPTYGFLGTNSVIHQVVGDIAQ